MGFAAARSPLGRCLTLLLLALLAPKPLTSNSSEQQEDARASDLALHELFPRVPLFRWAHIQRSFEDEDAPLNSRSEGYQEVAEMLSDASEVSATPGREADGLEILRKMVQRWDILPTTPVVSLHSKSPGC
jgi:hypothetical protein